MCWLMRVHAVTPEVLGLFANNAQVSDLKGITRYVTLPHRCSTKLVVKPSLTAAASSQRLMTIKCALLCGGPSPR
jgi:hypothetical protein